MTRGQSFEQLNCPVAAALAEARSLASSALDDAHAKAASSASIFKEMLGIDTRYSSVPSKTFTGDASKPHAQKRWSQTVTKHVKTVVNGRLESDESARAVAKAIMAEGTEKARRLVDTPEFAQIQKEIVK